MTDLDDVAEALARNLRDLRRSRGWSLDALAGRAGVSKGVVVALEQGRANPSLTTLIKLGDALDVPLPRLIATAEHHVLHVVGPDDGAVLWRGERGGYARVLAGVGEPHPVETWCWELAPGDHRDSDAHPAGTVELAVVTSGVLDMTVGEERAEVPAGAAVRFAADWPHRYANTSTEFTRFVLTVVLP